MQDINLDDIERRPQRYWNADGIPELCMGVLWMLWGGAWLVGMHMPRGTLYYWFWMFVPALLAFSSVAAIWATRALKARLTFPRTGYVAWKEPRRAAQIGAAAVSLVAAAVLAGLAVKARANGATSQMAAPVLSVILSLGFLVASVREHAPHYLALAGVCLALAMAYLKANSGWDSANWVFVILGAASAATGGLRLYLFLRAHPPQAEAA